MIPWDHTTEWRDRAPWSEDFQVEQDLVISRALVAMYSDPVLAEALESVFGFDRNMQWRGSDLVEILSTK